MSFPVLMRPSARNKILCFLALMSLMFNSASSLECVQCVSLHTPSCYSGNQPVTPCTGQDSRAKFCYKTLAYDLVTGHLTVVTRGCAEHEHNNCTDDTRVSGDQYKKCFYTCKEDGCNGSSRTTSATGAMGLCLTIAFLHWHNGLMSLYRLCRWVITGTFNYMMR